MAGEGRPTSFGALLRQHRLAAGLTQEALAERAGISVRAVQHLERALGKPQRETTRRLADALALSADARDEFGRSAVPAPRRRARPGGMRAASSGRDAVDPRHDLGGERRQVTILVAGAAGLTESAEHFEPDLADELLADMVPLLVDILRRYEGTVSVRRGDGVVAVFGAPLAHEDHAVRACYAALAMHEAIRAYTGQVATERGIGVALRVGLDSGEVVVRTASNGHSTAYTPIGPAVHAAARLQQIARDWTTALTRETARLAEGYVRVRPRGAAPGSELMEPPEAFELVGVQPPRSRFQRVVRTRPLTPFAGREVELTSLALPLERARTGHGQIVALVGEAGVGKSRLVWESAQSDRTAGWRILETGTDSSSVATSYRPLIDLLKRCCRIEPEDDAPTAREKVVGTVLALDSALATDLPPLVALLGLPVEDAAWLALDPPHRRRQTLNAVKRLLLCESRGQPLLLIFEDLHWIDSESQALLDGLVESLPTARILLLVSYRPEYEHRWAGKSYYAQIHVDALPASGAAELLAGLLGSPSAGGGSADLDALKQLLVERTEGNPLFLEESVQVLVEAGALVGERGAYRLAKPIASVRLPATVQTVLAARIDRLEPEARRLLQLAAVVGTHVPLPLLRAIADLPDDVLQHGVSHLQAADLLYEVTLFPEPEYTFKHAVTHEVAYGSLLQPRRRALHARIMRAVEQLFPDRLAEQVERLAHHALRGEVWEAAAAYCREAGSKDVARSAHRAAAIHLQQALDAVRHWPDGQHSLETAIDLHLELRNALVPLGAFNRMAECLRQAATLAEALGDRHRLALVLAQLGHVSFAVGDQVTAFASTRRALAIAQAEGDGWVEGMAIFYLGRFDHVRGDYRRAAERIRAFLALVPRHRVGERLGGATAPALNHRASLAHCLAELGEFAEGRAVAEEALEMCEAVDAPIVRSYAWPVIGEALLVEGQLERAIAVLERAIDLARTWDFPVFEAIAGAILGYAYALVGRVSEALVLLESTNQDQGQQGYLIGQAQRSIWLGEALLLAGRPDDALRQARRALDLSYARRERGHEAYALRLLGEIGARVGPTDVAEAERQYHEALALAEELGMRPLQARCHLGLGKLYRRVRPGEARAELATAVEMLREMGMTLWLPEAEAELAATTR